MSDLLISPLGVQLPEGWQLRPVGDLCVKIGSGATPKGGATVYTDTGTNFIRSQNVFDHYFSSAGLVHIDDQAAEKLVGVTVRERDVLFNITGDGETIARCCVAPNWILPARVNQHVMILRTTGDLAPEYLQRYLSQPAMRVYMLNHNSGGSRRALTKAQAAGFQIAVPPIREQKAIAAVLGALDDKIAVNERIAATTQEILSQLFSYHVWNYGRSAGLPAGFSQGTVRDVCEQIGNGGTPKRKNPEYWERGNVAWYKTGELHDGPLLESTERITDLGVRESSCSVWPAGTVLVALYASPTVGRLGILESPAAFNQACSGLLAKESLGELFLFETLKATRSKLQGIAVGSAQQNISQRILADHQVVIPTVEAAASFNGVAQPLHRRRVAAAHESRTLTTLRDTLLPQLMSGRLRVKDAEKIVEDHT